MRRFILPLALIVSAALAACEAGPQAGRQFDTSAQLEMAPPMAAPMAAKQSADMAEDGSAPAAQSFMAYRYGYQVSLPAKAVEPVMQAHMQRCASAGPSQCQVLMATTNSGNDAYSRANLQLRAEPSWLATFRSDLEPSVKEQGGKITASNVSAEDLTRQILDVDARLSAQKGLRDRLMTLLETRDAELSDLLSVERELARVQGQIESATATLKALRARVSMSIVDINYQSEALAVSSSAFAPVREALKSFVGDVSYGLAMVISLIAFLLPWMLFLILPGYFALRWLLRRRKKPAPSSA